MDGIEDHGAAGDRPGRKCREKRSTDRTDWPHRCKGLGVEKEAAKVRDKLKCRSVSFLRSQEKSVLGQKIRILCRVRLRSQGKGRLFSDFVEEFQ